MAIGHHVAITRDAGTGIADVYVDGVLNATSASNSSPLDTGAKTTPFFLIGALSVVRQDDVTFDGATFFNGQLDDVQVFNQVVSAGFIASEALPPGAPSLAVTPASGTELDLSWTEGSSNVTGFEVWSSINGGNFSRIAQLPATATSYLDVGLTGNTPYSFYVVAVGYAGSNASNTVNTSTPTPPATPSNVTVTNLTPTEIDLQWVNNATTATGYQILRRTGTGDYSPVAQLPANSTTYQDTNVQPGTTYDYHVEAYNIAGYSDFAGISVTTPGAVTFASYMTSYGITNPTLAAPGADPYDIGISNLLAYALNLNPTAAVTAGLPVVTQENGYMTIAFVERISPTDVNYTVEVSGDMMAWNSGPNYTTLVSVTPIDGATQMVTVRDNTLLNTVPLRFIR